MCFFKILWRLSYPEIVIGKNRARNVIEFDVFLVAFGMQFTEDDPQPVSDGTGNRVLAIDPVTGALDGRTMSYKLSASWTESSMGTPVPA